MPCKFGRRSTPRHRTVRNRRRPSRPGNRAGRAPARARSAEAPLRRCRVVRIRGQAGRGSSVPRSRCVARFAQRLSLGSSPSLAGSLIRALRTTPEACGSKTRPAGNRSAPRALPAPILATQPPRECPGPQPSRLPRAAGTALAPKLGRSAISENKVGGSAMRLRLPHYHSCGILMILAMAGMLQGAAAATPPGPARATSPDSAYTVKPGDMLAISVWKEPDLQGPVLVRPDGTFSFPLAGQMDARNKTVAELQ